MQWYNGLSSLIFIYIQAHYTIQEKKNDRFRTIYN